MAHLIVLWDHRPGVSSLPEFLVVTCLLAVRIYMSMLRSEVSLWATSSGEAVKMKQRESTFFGRQQQ